ncbi:periplasmic protein complex localization protein [Paenibacillus sp. P1XP2]|nr:periplasmic protein complex localization protein [Paenibacillus sp. P1XP2]
MIAVTGKAKVNDFKMSGPDRIVVDLENTGFSDTFSSASLDQNKTGSLDVDGYPDVSKVRYSLYNSNPSTVRIVIDLNYAKNYKLTNDNGLYIVDLNTSDSGTPSKPAQAGKRSSSSMPDTATMTRERRA